MDTALTTALMGLVGSVVGGLTSYMTTALNQRHQERQRHLEQIAEARAQVYDRFIEEASRQYTRAWEQQGVSPSDLMLLHALTSKMRINSHDVTVAAAHRVIDDIADASSAPSPSPEQLRRREEQPHHPLYEFALACRAEIDAKRSKIGAAR